MSSMRPLAYTSFFALASVYGVMVLGSYVSAAGLGLSCIDWPTCRGSFLPSEEIMAEWVHRLFALMAGISVVTMAALSWRVRNTRLRLTATLAAVFVITQIVLGIIVIDSRLHPLIVSIHLAIGVLLFASTLLTALAANRLYKASLESIR
ncbi:MAG: COX15/CtaA family protein [Candidatus Nitrosocaldus sp.]